MEKESKERQPLRWGLISTARINQAVIQPLGASDQNELVAVASRSIEKSQAYAAEWNIPNAFGSYQAMLDDPSIDVVYISLPNSLHAEWTIKALKAGKHVLCEKPLATTLEEVDQMRNAAQETGKHLAEAFMYRHHPQTLRVKELLESGILGEVRMIKGAFTFSIRSEGDVRLNPDLGGGSIWDVGCYPINIIRFILGEEPQEVFGWQKIGDSGVDEVFSGQMRFSNSIFAQFDSGFRSPYRSRIEIIGSEASIVIPNPFRPGEKSSIHINRGGDTEPMTISGRELYIGEIEDMADVILNGSTPRISLEDSRGNVKTILALKKSAESGGPVSM